MTTKLKKGTKTSKTTKTNKTTNSTKASKTSKTTISKSKQKSPLPSSKSKQSKTTSSKNIKDKIKLKSSEMINKVKNLSGKTKVRIGAGAFMLYNMYNSPLIKSMFNNLFKNSVLRKKYDFNKLEYIGGGAFGKVYKTTTLKEPQIDVIVKIQILPMQDLLNALSGDDSPFIRNEKNILNYLKKIELPKLSEFLDYEFIKESESYSFVSVYKAKYSSTLNNYLLKNTLSNKDKVSLITNLIDSVYSMHKNNLAHSDLKPHNIIIGTNETCEKDVEIIDFGLSCIKSLVSNCLYGGTPYFAPDLFKNIPKSITFQLPLWLGGGAKYDDIVTYDNYALMVCIFDILTNNKYYEDGSIQKKYQEFEKYRNDIPSKLREMMFQTFLMEEIPNAEKIKKLWEGVKKELV